LLAALFGLLILVTGENVAVVLLFVLLGLFVSFIAAAFRHRLLTYSPDDELKAAD
jgi:hypothetical protein